MKQTRQVMGMPITIEVIAKEAAAKPLLAQAFDYFNHVDAVFSTYKPTSQISRINSGQLKLKNAEAEVQQVLRACEDFKVRTDGFFDVQRPDGTIDPSGLVKGWAIANAAKLIQAEAKDYFVSAGGDVQTGGLNSRGMPWLTGITHPTELTKFAKVVKLSNLAIATSGIYERGHHIYNPKTGQPAAALLSLSVIGPDIYEADVLATAAFAMGPDGLNFIIGQGLEGFMITSDLKAFATPGFADYEA